MAQSTAGQTNSLPPATGKTRLTVSREELLVDGSDGAFRQFIHDILAFSARIQEISARLGEVIGLSMTQYLVLIAIRQHQGEEGAGVNQVAQHLHLSGAFMTMEINKLVTAGLVSKKTNQEDRRRVLLNLTPRAISLLTQLTAVQQPVNDVLFAGLTRADFDRLRSNLSELVDSADRAVTLAAYLSKSEAGRIRE